MPRLTLDKGDTRLIIEECKARGLLRNQVAYVLATAYWETARTMKPIRERGGERYLRRKRYYPHVGMGYAQVTWERNYRKVSIETGVDCVANPKHLLDPDIAKVALVVGMVEGWYTGKKLSNYITLKKSDYVNARRIINGTDKKHEIAALAKQFEDLLLAEAYGVEPRVVEVEVIKEVQKPTPKQVKDVVEDADKPWWQSKTILTHIFDAGAVSAVVQLLENKPIAYAIAAVIVLAAAYRIYDRIRKANLAKSAQIVLSEED